MCNLPLKKGRKKKNEIKQTITNISLALKTKKISINSLINTLPLLDASHRTTNDLELWPNLLTLLVKNEVLGFNLGDLRDLRTLGLGVMLTEKGGD